jgi:sporulation protein YlmC with PRC-barrel domain
MRESATLNLSRELRGRRVLMSGSPWPLGEVTDALVHPTEGTLLGLAVRTPAGDERVLDARRLSIREDAVVALDPRPEDEVGTATRREGAFALREIVGASLVTDAGQLVGRVSEVYVPPRGGEVEYGVAPAGARRLLGGALRLSAAAPHSFSRVGSRLIVPAGELAGDRAGFEGEGRGRLGLRLWMAGQSARLLLYRYGVFLWFVISVSLIGMMVWV